MQSLQGRVICTTNDKTVNVEVVRLAPHPKCKRRVRKKKTFQAHDPENQFQIGDIVLLEECKPVSKKKTFLAVPVPKRTASKELGISKTLAIFYLQEPFIDSLSMVRGNHPHDDLECYDLFYDEDDCEWLYHEDDLLVDLDDDTVLLLKVHLEVKVQVKVHAKGKVDVKNLSKVEIVS
ncbi:hypothetical protein L1987_31551 [Smallanthus sonchifolius]|uniref:Uncharacterized protein n=1 Tax=Smallanthus sonchifolius TaxID=185202 RepID=A0ACB9I5X7_9ASTR|nr:hypothetical protein L1987_31551 [Smallanthus sonchifolius]